MLRNFPHLPSDQLHRPPTFRILLVVWRWQNIGKERLWPLAATPDPHTTRLKFLPKLRDKKIYGRRVLRSRYKAAHIPVTHDHDTPRFDLCRSMKLGFDDIPLAVRSVQRLSSTIDNLGRWKLPSGDDSHFVVDGEAKGVMWGSQSEFVEPVADYELGVVFRVPAGDLDHLLCHLGVKDPSVRLARFDCAKFGREVNGFLLGVGANVDDWEVMAV